MNARAYFWLMLSVVVLTAGLVYHRLTPATPVQTVPDPTVTLVPAPTLETREAGPVLPTRTPRGR